MIVALRRWLHRFFRDANHRDEVQFFRHVSIFQNFSARQLGRIIQSIQKRDYHAGETLFEEGQVGRAMFIVRSGKVELSKATPAGPRSLGILGPGHLFGEMVLLESRPRTASARVVEEGTMYLLYTASLESLMRRQPEIGAKLFRNIALMLSALLRRSNEQLASVTRS